jgi:hypothetical protein
MCTLNFHPNWVILQLNVTNAFNLVSKRVIFRELHALCENIIQFSPFVQAFYAFESPLFYSHYNHDGNVMVIPSAMGICQNHFLGKALFALTHFRALHFTINHFPSYIFPSIINNTHIINPPSPPLYPLHMNIFKLISM